MMLTRMDDALARFKIPFDTTSNWERDGHGQMSDVLLGIIIHHTGGGGINDWQTVKNGRPGLDGPLAHNTFERNGRVKLIGAGQCWHAGTGRHPKIGSNNGNTRCIGIEGVSNGSTWSNDQYPEEYPRLAAAYVVEYSINPDGVIGHKEWAPSRKVDPGNWDMNAFRRDVRKNLTGGGGAGPSQPVIVARRKSILLF